MKFNLFFDERQTICKYELQKNGLKDIELSGFYYFGLILRTYFNYSIQFFPYYDVKYFLKTIKYYKSSRTNLKNIESVLMTLSIVAPTELTWFMVKRPLTTLPYFIIGNRLFLLYPLLVVFDVLNIFRRNPETKGLYLIYRNVTPFKIVTKIINKFVSAKHIEQVFQEYFHKDTNRPPIYVLFDNLVKMVVK